MTATEAIEYIHSMVWNRRATGYEHARLLLEKMGNPEKRLKYIHIGGTNGKGSTSAMLASILQKAGYKTGLYTSPYLYRFQERIQIDGEEIPDEDLAEVTAYVKSCADELEECPSEFALVCCIAFEYFARMQCDIVVLEVGMGGANDSTNVIEEAEVTVLTNIGLDHTQFLGTTLEEIARTKAGIVKAHGSIILYPNVPEVERVFQSVCEEKDARLQTIRFEELERKAYSLEGQSFHYQKRKDLLIPLLGQHQLHNAALALSVVEQLIEKGWKITEEAICQGLQTVKWPGRFEVISREPIFIIDGGHNAQCIEALAGNVNDYLQGHRVIAITGILEDKDDTKMFRPILPLVEEFVCITPPCPRRLEARLLAQRLQSEGAKAIACATIEEGIDYALKSAGEQGAILCFGSMYSIGELKEQFEARRDRMR